LSQKILKMVKAGGSPVQKLISQQRQ